MRLRGLRRLRGASFVLTALAGLLLAGLFLVNAQPAFAVQPDEILADPKLEARAREISSELRCLVCQNQSIDDSSAPLARDLRLLVRERLKANDTNEQVRDYIVARYGDFVLLKPPMNPETLLLWLTPLLVLLGAVWLARRSSFANAPQVRADAVDAPLSAQERARLNELLKGDQA